LELAKRKDTGIKLEVNGQILDACTHLMNAIKQLIHDAKELQKEIVSQGRVSFIIISIHYTTPLDMDELINV